MTTSAHSYRRCSPFSVTRTDELVVIARSPLGGQRSATTWGAHAQSLLDLLNEQFDDGASTILVDLARSHDVSTAVLAVLVIARARARTSGTNLIVLGSPDLDRFAEICRLDGIISTGVPSAPSGRSRPR